MENRLRESFHLIWLAAIVLCVLAGLFALLYGSFAQGTAEGWTELPSEPAVTTVSAASAEPAAPAETLEPVTTPEPTQIPEETPLPEPQG